jgi:hypothetical protein
MTARFKMRKILAITLWVVSITIVLGYGTWRALLFIQGPSITVETPRNGVVVSDPFIEIRGSAKNISFITLNGARIYLNDEGVFDEHMLLAYGYNVITTEAVDRFGRKVRDDIEVVYK